MGSLAIEPSAAHEMTELQRNGHAETAPWVLNSPDPPSLWHKLMDVIRKGSKFPCLQNQDASSTVISALQAVFPILSWCRNYKSTNFKNDLLAGLTLASLCIPQSIGYATLAKLDPQYGLYTSVVPPLIYAVMGTSRELAVGPVAVVSLLLASMTPKVEDPMANPIAYRNVVLTTTFFAGIFQTAFGLFRLGFLVDFLSHAAIVGFTAGAAIVIGLQQLKGLLGITHFTNKTDVISVLKVIWISVHDSGRKNKKLFWLPAIAPLISVVLSTLIVFLTRADKHGVNIIKHIKEGLNPSSVHQLQFKHPQIGEVAKIGLIVAVVALAEATAVSQAFASMKGYHIDGNKEMIAIGFMNIFGSFTSCYAATGSFSRSAVNFSAGCETAVSNIVMAITVIISLELLTRLLYFTPVAVLSSIIIAALPGLINLNEAYKIWKIDKLDFLACIGAYLGVLFASVEIGLLAAVAISFVKIIIVSIVPGTEILGRVPGTEVFCDVNQYPMAVETPPALVIRVKSGLLSFANASFIKEKITKWATKDEEDSNGYGKRTVQLVILDMTSLINIDTSGIYSLEELHKNLVSNGIELAMINPRWQVIHKLRLANFVKRIGGRVFLTVGEAVDACLNDKTAAI